MESNYIRLNLCEKVNNKVIYHYEVSDSLKHFFNLNEEAFIEYTFELTNIPDSIIAIPFVCNVLPIIWLTNSTLEVHTLDKNFLSHVDEIKQGYMQMYPSLCFQGNIKTMPESNYVPESKINAGCFFSGGVDAYTTLYRHVDEAPALLTIWGADIDISDTNGWQIIDSFNKKVAEQLSLTYFPIKSSFRRLLNFGEQGVSLLLENTPYEYWHDFQHGIAIISHGAPIAYAYGMEKVYIASSFSEQQKGTYVCASDPTIDNYVYFGNTQTIHDGYELTRQDKIAYLVNYPYSTEKPNVHVCWISSGGKNCCQCEKCYRTILEIVSEGGNPNEFGFIWNDASIKKCKRKHMIEMLLPQYRITSYYYPIMNRMKENNIKDIDKYEWLFRINWDKFNDYPCKKMYHCIISLLKSIKRGLKKFIYSK
ncbi:MAG: hypothetical protein IJN64_13805 [Lachnospiraceae bacterium]|nr:hypothetical protein [Lachnospiraceae bacterium]